MPWETKSVMKERMKRATSQNVTSYGYRPWLRILIVPSSQAFFFKFLQIHNVKNNAMAILDLYRIRALILQDISQQNASPLLRAACEQFCKTYLEKKKAKLFLSVLDDQDRLMAISVMGHRGVAAADGSGSRKGSSAGEDEESKALSSHLAWAEEEAAARRKMVKAVPISLEKLIRVIEICLGRIENIFTNLFLLVGTKR